MVLVHKRGAGSLNCIRAHQIRLGIKSNKKFSLKILISVSVEKASSYLDVLVIAMLLDQKRLSMMRLALLKLPKFHSLSMRTVRCTLPPQASLANFSLLHWSPIYPFPETSFSVDPPHM